MRLTQRVVMLLRSVSVLGLTFLCAACADVRHAEIIDGQRAALVAVGSPLPLDEPLEIPTRGDEHYTGVVGVASGFLAAYMDQGELWTLRLDENGQAPAGLPRRFTLTGPSPTGFLTLASHATRALFGDYAGVMLMLDDQGTPVTGTTFRVDPSTPAVKPQVVEPYADGFVLMYARDGDIHARVVDNDGTMRAGTAVIDASAKPDWSVRARCAEDECLVMWSDTRGEVRDTPSVYVGRIGISSLSSLDGSGVRLDLGRHTNMLVVGDDYLASYETAQGGVELRIPRGMPISPGLPQPDRAAPGLLPFRGGFVDISYDTLFFYDSELVRTGFRELTQNGASIRPGSLVVSGDRLLGHDRVRAVGIDPDSGVVTAPSTLLRRTRNEQRRPAVVAGATDYLVIHEDDRAQDGWFSAISARHDIVGRRMDEPTGTFYPWEAFRTHWLLGRYVRVVGTGYPFGIRAAGGTPLTYTNSTLWFASVANVDWRRVSPDVDGHAGRVIVAWPDAGVVRLRELDPQTFALRVTQRALTTAISDARDVHIRYNGRQFLVVWSALTGTRRDIYGIRLDADGVPIERTPVQLSSLVDDDTFPRLAWNGTSYLLAWSQFTGTPASPQGDWYESPNERLFGAVISEDLTEIGPASELGTGFGAVGSSEVFTDGSRFVVRALETLRYFDEALTLTDEVTVPGMTGAASIGGGHTLVAQETVDADGFSRAMLRILSRGSELGQPCSEGSECTEGLCVDGVCCASACEGTADCMACSVAAGGTLDGVCMPIPQGTTCRAQAGECDLAEVCDGSSPSCPPDLLVEFGNICRHDRDGCDQIEICDGVGPACPEDIAAPDGTSCDDYLACTGTDLCSAGQCVHTPPACEAPDACHTASCGEPNGCVIQPVADCCLRDDQCDDVDACTEDRCVEHACQHTAGACEEPDAGVLPSEPDAGVHGPDAGADEDAGTSVEPADGSEGPTPEPRDGEPAEEPAPKGGGCALSAHDPRNAPAWLLALALTAFVRRRRPRAHAARRDRRARRAARSRRRLLPPR